MVDGRGVWWPRVVEPKKKTPTSTLQSVPKSPPTPFPNLPYAGSLGTQGYTDQGLKPSLFPAIVGYRDRAP
jgi:hypothetical protein